MITARCLAPMRMHEHGVPRLDTPVCWRPLGHSGPERHLSRWAYLRELERCRRNKAIDREVARVLARMSEAESTVSA